MFNMIPSETEAVYTSRQVIDLVKITYRKLYHWQKNGVITCCRPGKGRGKVSLFSFTDILETKVVAHLVKSGVKLSAIKESISHIRKELATNPYAVGLRSVRVLTDGRQIYIPCPDRGDQVLEVTEQGQYGFAFGFDIEEQRNSIIREAKQLNIDLPIRKRA